MKKKYIIKLLKVIRIASTVSVGVISTALSILLVFFYPTDSYWPMASRVLYGFVYLVTPTVGVWIVFTIPIYVLKHRRPTTGPGGCSESNS